VEADAFGAYGGNDVIDILRDRGMALAVEVQSHRAGVNRRVGAFGLAGPAVDAFARDRRRHLMTLFQWGTA